MKYFVLIILYLFFYIPCYSETISEYINSYAKTFETESYKSFTKVIKGQASISDYEKQYILDREISSELQTPFIYTDLEECINIALHRNYDIKIADAKNLEAFWLNKNAQFQLLPDIYYDFNIKGLTGNFLVGGIVSTRAHEVAIQSMFGVEWSTISQGRYFFYLAQTRNMLKSTNASLEFSKDEIILNTVQAYYDVLGLKKEIEVQKTNLFDRVEQLKYTNARYEAGLGTYYDVKRAQAEVAGAQQDYTNTLNSFRLSQANLANILGVDVFDGIYPYEIEVDKRVLVDANYSIEELYKQAIQAREDVKAKSAEVNVYRAIRNANYTDIIPDITFSYQNGYVGTVRAGMYPNNVIALDVKTSLGKNLLMGTISKVKSDSAVVKQKKLELITLKRQIKEDIISSYYDSQNALKNVDASKVEVEAADVSLELSIANMKAGQATFIDVIASQNLKVQANLNLIKNMIEYNKAQTKLLFDIGVISPKNVLKDYSSRFY